MNSQAAAIWNRHVDIFFAKTGGIITQIVAVIAQWLVNHVAVLLLFFVLLLLLHLLLLL